MQKYFEVSCFIVKRYLNFEFYSKIYLWLYKKIFFSLKYLGKIDTQRKYPPPHTHLIYSETLGDPWHTVYRPQGLSFTSISLGEEQV